MARFTGVDFYEIDPLLTEDERQIRDHVRDWVEDRYLPIIEQAYEEAYFPMEVVPELAAHGPVRRHAAGGVRLRGLSHTAYGLAMQELERGDSGLRSFVSVQGALCMYPIFAFGSDEQRRRWLPRMARGEVIGCFGLTEPDSRLRPRRHDHPRRARGKAGEPARLRAQRRQDVDHQRHHRRPRRRLGQAAERGDGTRRGPRASWSRRARRASRPRSRSASTRCAPRSPASSCSRTCSCRRRTACRRPGASRRRWPACRRRATASPGACSARRWPASTRRPSTRRRASCSASRSARSSWCRRSWP